MSASPNSSSVEIGVVRTGIANLASVFAGLRRAGGSPRLIDTPDEVERVPLLVLPGVGAFGPAMSRLRERELVAPLVARFRTGRPMLAICLGLQLLCEESEESPGIRGLGVLAAKATRFRGENVCVPQLGWNRVRVDEAQHKDTTASRAFEDGYAYFANSYKLDPFAFDATFLLAQHEHGRDFVAGLELGGGKIIACQLHPELSGSWGLRLLRTWIAASLNNCERAAATSTGETTC